MHFHFCIYLAIFSLEFIFLLNIYRTKIQILFFAGYEKLEFTVANYTSDSSIVLVSNHYFKPIVEVAVHPLDTSHTFFSVNITFNKTSLLYQVCNNLV